MHAKKKTSLFLIAALSFWVNRAEAAVPTSRPATRSQSPKSASDVLVTVNGVPIGEADVRLATSSAAGHNEAAPAAFKKDVLEGIVQRELFRQKAVELGLDSDPQYQETLRRIDVQVNAFKRRELSELFARRQIAQGVQVTEAEARKYFTENEARIRTELHVWQILRRQEALVEQARADIQRGTPFQEVAARGLPKLPETGRAPWDLGYLGWRLVPEPWRDVVYDLKPGEVSRVIRGPNNRFWIVKLIDKRENTYTTFEAIKPTVMEVLKSAKIEELRAKTERDLRAKADIVYLKGLVRAPEGPQE